MKTVIKTLTGIAGNSLWLFFLATLIACETSPVHEGELEVANLGVKNNNNVVEVTTTHMNLEVVSEISSGWTTFRYQNLSHNTHFFLLNKLPEGKTVEDSKNEVVPVFQEGMDYIAAGDWDAALAAFGKLPAWSANIIYSGGTGLLAPNRTSEITVFLEPGNYALECYVKNAAGDFHSSQGMISGLTATTKNSGNTQPKETMAVNISSSAGIEFDEKIRPGKHLIKVHFEDQAVYSHFLGHDVHLVKLEENADLDELNAWMNWSDPNAFKTPVPAGVEFMGGMQDLPALEGKPFSMLGYFEILLKPGTYAFIAEIPDPRSKNMFKIFTVPGN